MGKKQLQCTNCPISPEVQAIGQWNLVSPQKITRETFFLKHDTQNVVEKLVPETFLKNQNRAYLWIMSMWRAIKRYGNYGRGHFLLSYLKLFLRKK